MILINIFLVFSIFCAFVNGQNSPQNGAHQRPYVLSPQIIGKLQQQAQQQQQQQNLQQQHAQQQKFQQNQQQNTQAHDQQHQLAQQQQQQQVLRERYQAQQLAAAQQRERAQLSHSPPKQQPQAQAPKYVSRNSIETTEGYNKQRYTPQQQGQKATQEKPAQAQESEEDYYEDEGPDKLTLLLQKSKFVCPGKKDGYYADETLNCEVFHYCQEGKKHSWMCPEGFGFHQVHLICMPPSQDNICSKSQSFHFVNEYLYRPINEKEAASTNTSLKYADRYYPDNYTPGMAIDELQESQPYQPRAPQRFSEQGNRNVFYNSESVNIPLNQRRPQLVAARQREPQQQQQSQSQEYYDE